MTLKFETDVVIIGGGLSGMMAALAVRSQGAKAIIVDRTVLGLATNTALSNGVFGGPTDAYDANQYIEDTLRIGRYLTLPWMAAKVAAELPGAIDRLRKLGVEMAEKKDHYYVVAESGEFPGAALVRPVADYLRSDKGIVRVGGTRVDRILVSKDRAAGIHGHNRDGQDVYVTAGAVILAAGGAGALYLRNDNQKSTLGKGYALAANAGLPLWDMEFIQYYPVVMAEANLPSMMLNSPHPKGSRIITSDGRDIGEIHGIEDINDAIRNKRDWLSAVLFEECRKGQVYMDYRMVEDQYKDSRPLSLLTKRKFDFTSRPVSISPAAHYVMGGVRINETCVTDLPGLFACGEVVWGLHGACRKGGNALSECLVFGHQAGLSAAGVFGHGNRPSEFQEQNSQKTPGQGPDRSLLRQLRRDLQTLAWDHAGVVREAENMRKGIKRLEEIFSRIRELPAYPPEAERSLADLLSMVTVLRAILEASRARLESRGCFIRSDYLEEDNSLWLKNSCVTKADDPDGIGVSHYPGGKDRG